MSRARIQKKRIIPTGGYKNGGWFRLFPWIWLVAAYCITFLVLSLCGRPYIDSDMSSEMVLADLLNREGKVVTTSWWYSTEIKVCSLQMFYQIGLCIFPHDWYAARMLGQALLVLALILLYLYVGHGLKFKNCGVWGAAALACPFGVWYLWYCLFGGYYIAYMLWTMLSFGTMFHLLDSTNRISRIIQSVLLVGSCLISGLNSVKGAMVFYVPMFLATVIVFFLRWRNSKKVPAKELRLLELSAVALVLVAIGYAINSTILAARYNFLNYNTLEWKPLALDELLNKYSDFLSLFGYPGGDSFLNPKIELFSLSGLLGCCGILTAGAIVVSLIRLLLRWRQLRGEQLIIPILLASILVVEGLIFSWTGGVGTVAPSHWLPTVPFAFLVLQLEGETEAFRLKFTRKAAALAFCGCVVATSISTVRQFPVTGYALNPHLKTVCEWLVQNGYTNGYASYWNANVMTEWSNGHLDIWVAPDFKTMDRVYEWLQKTEHQNPPEGEIFLLTTDQELEDMGLAELPSVSKVVYEETEQISDKGCYIVMEYSSAEKMMAVIETVELGLEEGTE